MPGPKLMLTNDKDGTPRVAVVPASPGATMVAWVRRGPGWKEHEDDPCDDCGISQCVFRITGNLATQCSRKRKG